MTYALTRPKFDTAIDSVSNDIPLHPAQRDTLWTALRRAITGDLKPSLVHRTGWTPEAHALRRPLLREIEACRKRSHKPRDDIHVTLPSPGKRAPRVLGTHDTFNEYISLLRNTQQFIEEALIDGHHWRTVANANTEPQPLAVIAANQHTLGLPAGTLNWVQWVPPADLTRISAVFAAANALTPGRSRAKWTPFNLPPSGLSDRGRAEHARRCGAWQSAFHDALYAAIDECEARTKEHDPGAHLLHDFYVELAGSTWLLSARAEAAVTQTNDKRTPANPLFRPPNSIWHALPAPARVTLAAKYDAVLRAAYEACMSLGESEHARAYNPSWAFNPWSLTDSERADLSAAQA